MIKDFHGVVVAEYHSVEESINCSLNADLIRVEIPSNSDDIVFLQKRGFFFADRTIGVSISLNKINVDLDRCIRVETILESSLSVQVKEKILKIAVDSFLYDRRFNLRLKCSKDISNKVISEYIKEIDHCFLAYYKGEIIGFLYLKEIDEECYFVELAAVAQKYRITGAALSLYASAVKWGKENRVKVISGRVSTQNSAVMNLYNFFGGTYFDPHDVFIKENNNGLR